MFLIIPLAKQLITCDIVISLSFILILQCPDKLIFPSATSVFTNFSAPERLKYINFVDELIKLHHYIVSIYIGYT